MWFLLLVWGLQLPAQVPFIREKRDYRWQVGADIWGNIAAELNFNADSLVISNRPATLPMDVTKTDICDRDGNLLFYTNGYTIMNRLHEVMENGAGLSPGILTNDWLPYGEALHQGALFLPVPDVDSLYILMHARAEYLSQMNQYGQHHSTWPLYYSVIERSPQYPDGRVTEKNVVLYEGQVTFGQISACRHANGRDWWVLVFKHFSNEYLRYLLHPGGIMAYPADSVGVMRRTGVGQAVFSPDGTQYAKFDLQMGPQLSLYDFDRCTGTLSNFRQLNYTYPTGISGGLAFSPNSRYLYVFSNDYAVQYDTYADETQSSVTLVAQYQVVPDMQRFSGGQLAPDGKIYISGQCPAAGGRSVWQARSLLALAGVDQVYSDDCVWNTSALGTPNDGVEEALIQEEKSKTEQILLIFPNPAQDRLTVRFQPGAAQYMQLADATGRPQWSLDVSSGLCSQGELLIDISRLTSGYYYFLFIDMNGHIHSQGISIIR